MAANGFCEEIIIAGFGGQGIMLTGKLLAQTAMKAGKEVTYMPSYGAEVRGGTANCTVYISDEEIASPVASSPDFVVAMNLLFGASIVTRANWIRHQGVVLPDGMENSPPTALEEILELLES